MQEGSSGDRKTAVLLVNLGTPKAPDRRHVAQYLREFLSDPRVIDLPRWLWLPLLNLVIIPLRASRSAAAYRKVWRADGSPLLALTRSLAAKMAAKMSSGTTRGEAGSMPVVVAMRYGEPSIPRMLESLRSNGTTDLVVLPLYPQYSRTTTASVYDAIESSLRAMQWNPPMHRIDDYHRDPNWIAAVAATIRAYRDEHGTAEMLLFSLHGIPQRYVAEGDPYQAQCADSVAAIAEAAGLRKDEWLLVYQSRVGREPWLMPYTDVTLQELAARGVRRVQVVSPGFAVDCLETLEEIAMRYAELFEQQFEQRGGGRLEYIPALNDSDAHVSVLQRLVQSKLQETSPSRTAVSVPGDGIVA